MTTTTETWGEWQGKIWETVWDRSPGSLRGLAAFEQVAFRSEKEKRCHVCGEPGIHHFPPGKYLASTGYWLCDDCDKYHKEKYGDEPDNS
mgnify:CR=1 FL=1